VQSCSDAVLGQHLNATVAIIHKCIADYLKLAPHRTGGADKGCRSQHLTALTGNENASNCSNSPETVAGDSQ